MENIVFTIFRLAFKLVTIIAIFFFVAVIVELVSNLYDKLRKYEHHSLLEGSTLSKFATCFFFFFGAFSFYMTFLSSSTTQIGSIYEADCYEETYYVYFYYDNKTTKCYKIPALIFANSESKYYSILNVQWPNGNVIYFPDDSYVLPNRKSQVDYLDSNGDEAECFIELTTEKYKK